MREIDIDTGVFFSVSYLFSYYYYPWFVLIYIVLLHIYRKAIKFCIILSCTFDVQKKKTTEGKNNHFWSIIEKGLSYL